MIKMPRKKKLEQEGTFKPNPVKVVSAIHAQKLVRRGRSAFYPIIGNLNYSPSNSVVPVVCDFLEVFSDDLLRMPLDWEVYFCIDLQPRTRSIYIPPYYMVPAEFRELKSQLQEWFINGFICLSLTPLGEPVLFVNKTNGSTRMCIDYHS